MIKHHIFVNKHLPVQTQQKVNSSKRYSICSNLLIKILQQCLNVITVLLLSLFDMILVCTYGVAVYSTY